VDATVASTGKIDSICAVGGRGGDFCIGDNCMQRTSNSVIRVQTTSSSSESVSDMAIHVKAEHFMILAVVTFEN